MKPRRAAFQVSEAAKSDQESMAVGNFKQKISSPTIFCGLVSMTWFCLMNSIVILHWKSTQECRVGIGWYLQIIEGDDHQKIEMQGQPRGADVTREEMA